jgi:hypothetical protein
MTKSVETPEMRRRRKAKAAVKALVIGAVLGLACRALPSEYQGPCETVLKICTGHL